MELISPEEAARYYGVYIGTVYRWLKKKKVIAAKIAACYRFDKAMLDPKLIKEKSFEGKNIPRAACKVCGRKRNSTPTTKGHRCRKKDDMRGIVDAAKKIPKKFHVKNFNESRFQ